MKTYIALYRIESILAHTDPPFGFKCQAEDADHAEEQCIDAYPDGEVVWIWEGDSLHDALADYWTVADFHNWLEAR
jgi:hypothetical protein